MWKAKTVSTRGGGRGHGDQRALGCRNALPMLRETLLNMDSIGILFLVWHRLEHMLYLFLTSSFIFSLLPPTNTNTYVQTSVAHTEQQWQGRE